jgi:hypothetical protein
MEVRVFNKNGTLINTISDSEVRRKRNEKVAATSGIFIAKEPMMWMDKEPSE